MPDLHRFYFDDGTSRKRWHVQTKGKSQLVQYGRLGGSLRESKKSFKSPAEAAAQTQKLIAKKEREGFLESAGYLLAGSFEEFLTRIALLFGDDEEV